jgi:hypothetical protein
MISVAFTFIPVNPADEDLSGGDSSKPEPLTERQKKDARNARERDRRAAKKRKALTKKQMEAAAGESSAEIDIVEEPAKKKRKGQKKAAKRPPNDLELSDEDDEPPKRFTVYFDIEGPKSATPLENRSPSSRHQKRPFFPSYK